MAMKTYLIALAVAMTSNIAHAGDTMPDYPDTGPAAVGIVAQARVYTERCETGLHDRSLSKILDSLQNDLRMQGLEKEYYLAVKIVTRVWESEPERQAVLCDVLKDASNELKQHWFAGDLGDLLRQLDSLSNADRLKMMQDARKRIYRR
jgi:hypothetical protein